MHSFWKNRLIKILVPYLVAHVVYYVIKTLSGEKFDLQSIIAGLLGQCTIVENSWYPIAALVMYAVFWLAQKSKHFFFISGILVVAVSIIATILFPTKNWWYVSNLAFWMGMIIARKDEPFAMWKKYVFIVVCSIVIAGLLPRIGMSTGLVSKMLIPNLKSCSAAIIAVLLTLLFSNENKIAYFLGKISYEIYLIHGLFIFLFVKVFQFPKLIVFPTVLISSIVAAWFLNIIDQRIIVWMKKRLSN